MSDFSLFEFNYWQELENDLLEMIFQALLLLKKESKEEVEENSINFILNRCFLKASRIKIKDRYGNFIRNRKPIYEAERISYEDDEIRNGRMGKRPDFQWEILDDNAPVDSITYSIVFTIECKRLGETYMSKAYVENGILRFIKKEWSYGEGTTSGAMIGYIQNSNQIDILKNINKICKSKSISNLVKYQNKNSDDIFSYTEDIKRNTIYPHNFLLYHFWIDLNNFPTMNCIKNRDIVYALSELFTV